VNDWNNYAKSSKLAQDPLEVLTTLPRPLANLWCSAPDSAGGASGAPPDSLAGTPLPECYILPQKAAGVGNTLAIDAADCCFCAGRRKDGVIVGCLSVCLTDTLVGLPRLRQVANVDQ